MTKPLSTLEELLILLRESGLEPAFSYENGELVIDTGVSTDCEGNLVAWEPELNDY